MRARARQLQPDEVQRAAFTITNPGVSGALIATPIINLPQVAIRDVEAIVRQPVVLVDAEGQVSIAIGPMVNLVLGWDHRAWTACMPHNFSPRCAVAWRGSEHPGLGDGWRTSPRRHSTTVDCGSRRELLRCRLHGS